METILNRYRSLTVLLAVIVAQLLLLAYQVKSNQEVRLIRIWAMTAVTPLARVIEATRSSTARFFSDYFVLLDVREENKSLKSEMNRLKIENQFLKTELSTADRARALAAFQTRAQSKTVAARIIGNAPGATSKVVLVDRGSTNGVERGMPVITPDGIVGKVTSVYQFASQVLLITDPTFAAGVLSQKSRVHGTLKGQGHSTCLIDYVQNEQKVETGDWFFTSGDDRVFPKGLPVGQATVVRQGKTFKEIYVVPSGLQNGLEEVLIVIEGVHQPIPESAGGALQPIKSMPPPPPDPGAQTGEQSEQTTPTPTGVVRSSLSTDADQLLSKYKRLGQAQGVKYGENSGKLPNFNQPVTDEKKVPVEPPKAPGGPPSPRP
ncbi:MAG: rod shape-determining protein MreC [Bryobacteraceae bacterium]